jgi:hypothetical protein
MVKARECPDKPTAKNNKANKRNPEKQIGSSHAGFWLKQLNEADALAKTNACRLVIERQEIAISSRNCCKFAALPGRLNPDQVDSEKALERAKALARTIRAKIRFCDFYQCSHAIFFAWL